MLFFCFSSKDRQEIVEAVLYHITNYAIPAWYDRQKMLLGDERNNKNFIEGVQASNYGLIILSPNSINSVCANEELDLMYEKYRGNSMVIFPVFYNINANEIPAKYAWLKKLVYKEITTSTDVRSACNHIICRILLDELNKFEIDTLDKLKRFSLIQEYDTTIYRIICSYLEIDDSNFNAKIALLYAACIYIESNYDMTNIPAYYIKGFQKLFNETKLSLTVNLREILIIERLFLLLANTTVLCNIIKNS